MHMDKSNAQSSVRFQEQSQNPGAAAGSLGSTVSGLLGDLQHIVRDEVQLAKSELKEDAGKMGKAGGMVAGAGVFGFTGFVFLMLGVTHLLSKKMEMWLSASIVGTALVTIAGVLGSMGKSEVQSAHLAPEQTIESVKENAEWVRQEASSVTK